MNDGTLETIDGRPALRFERTFTHSIERVWRAISAPAELERWFPAAADWTPATGETFEAYGATGEVTEVDRTPSPGLDLRRRAVQLRTDRAQETAAGWSSSTSSTTARSQRRPPPAGRPTSRASSPISPADTSPKRTAHEPWEEIHERYAERFGVDPDPGRRFLAAQRASR